MDRPQDYRSSGKRTEGRLRHQDATSEVCIDPEQRATATILAKQDCVLSGLGCVQRILDIYAQLDGKVTSHPDVEAILRYSTA